MPDQAQKPDPKRSDLSGPAFRAFSGLAAAWKLTEVDQATILGLADVEVLQRWKATRSPQLSDETLERISCLLGIFRAINTLLPNQDRADEWVRAANSAPLFGGGSALDRMMSGDSADLYRIRRYLDAQL